MTFAQPFGRRIRVGWARWPADERAWLAAQAPMRMHGDDIADFADTAALLDQMGLVVTIDTPVAHLAGALAKPVWIMLPFTADWRWLIDRDDSPWYPTARLFRQERPREWEGVAAAVAQALTEHRFVDSLKNAAA
jgi:ADP-heptose:LPS heptosyltransferase